MTPPPNCMGWINGYVSRTTKQFSAHTKFCQTFKMDSFTICPFVCRGIVRYNLQYGRCSETTVPHKLYNAVDNNELEKNNKTYTNVHCSLYLNFFCLCSYRKERAASTKLKIRYFYLAYFHGQSSEMYYAKLLFCMERPFVFIFFAPWTVKWQKRARLLTFVFMLLFILFAGKNTLYTD